MFYINNNIHKTPFKNIFRKVSSDNFFEYTEYKLVQKTIKIFLRCIKILQYTNNIS